MSLPLLVALLLGAHAVQETSGKPTPRRDEWQYLNHYFNVDGFSAERPRSRRGGLDGVGDSYSTGHLPPEERLQVRSERYGAIPFLRPSTEGNDNNMVRCDGQTIPVNTRRVFNVLFSLGMAHHGDHAGWIEFTFEDGTKGRGPIGFTDWFGNPVMGEESAFTIPVCGWVGNPPRGGPSIWLQRTPIPYAKRVVAMKLPRIPNVKILALTLAWRDGVKPAGELKKPPVKPALAAIFGENCFPHFNTRGDLTPARLRDAFTAAGIPAVVLGLEHLKDGEIFNPKAYPVFINPYGNTFPVDAEENLRAYRKGGGAMIHFGIPFTHPVTRNPYGMWVDAGHHSEYGLHEGEHAMGIGVLANTASREIVPQPALAEWGVEGIVWSPDLLRANIPPEEGFAAHVVNRASLHPEDEVVPLLGLKGVKEGPYAAIIYHRAGPFTGCTDIWLNTIARSLEPHDAPLEAAVQMALRGAAMILREAGRIDKDTYRRVTAPPPDGFGKLDPVRPVMPQAEWSWHLPGRPAAGSEARLAAKVLVVDVSNLSSYEKVLLASAQGLVNRSGGAASVCLVEGAPGAKALYRFATEEALGGSVIATPEDVLRALGHRKAVLVDPDLRGSLNLAVAVASTEGVLVAYPWLVEKYELDVAADLRGLFETQAGCLAWTLQNVGPRLDHCALAMVAPSPKSYAVLDYLIANKIFAFWISPAGAHGSQGACREEEVAFACHLLARTPAVTPVFMTPQTDLAGGGVPLLSRFGKYRVPLWGLSNLSFTMKTAGPAPAGSPGRAAVPPGEPPAAPARIDPKKVHLVLVRSDFTDAAGEDAAGSPPLGYAPPPALFDLLPALAARTAAAAGGRNVLGSSGLGEVDPATFGDAFGEAAGRVEEAYWKLCERSMKELGQKFIVLRPWSPANAGRLAAAARCLKSAETLLVQPLPGDPLHAEDAVYLLEGKPVLHAISADLGIFRPDGLAAGPFAGLLPAIAWGPVLGTDPGPLAADVRVVSPGDLPALCRKYLEDFALDRTPIVTAGSKWKYHDQGQDLGTKWTALAYDDAEWPSGPAELGYGDASANRPEATVVSFGPNSRNKHRTTYFRRAFEVKDPAELDTLSLEVLRDDGCVVHLNGREVARSNMPDGQIEFSTLAPSAIGGEDETRWHPFKLEPRLLRKGTNVLAVEVHQASPTSSDLSFDLKLTAYAKRTKAQAKPTESESSSTEKPPHDKSP